MEQFLVTVQDRKKALELFDVLVALKHIESVQLVEAEQVGPEKNGQPDFFAAAGLWADREVTQESIREQAWPSRS